MNKKTDEQIAVQVQRGDREAFGQIIDRYEVALIRYVSRILGDHEAAEDVTQEAFLKSYRDIQSFDGRRKFSSWLYRIAHNEAIDYIRKNKRVVTLEEAGTVASEEDLHGAAQKKIDRYSLRKRLDAAIGNISAKYRETVILRFYEEKEYDEIADILRIPIGTVGTYISRAKTELRTYLGDINLGDFL